MTSEIVGLSTGTLRHFAGRLTPSERAAVRARREYVRVLRQQLALVDSGEVEPASDPERAEEMQRLHAAWVAAEAQALGECER